MTLLDTELDITTQKVNNLEIAIIQINEQITAMNESLDAIINSLKETQRYLIKLAHNQQDLTKRISGWPYIVVNNRDEEA